MEFLLSNYPPLKTRYKTFYDEFYKLIPQSERIDIAVGYVSEDSLADLLNIIDQNSNIKSLNLVIGMHYFDRFTRIQYEAAKQLDNYLSSRGRGEVKLVTAFRYHGKLYSFSGSSGPFAGIVGSNNLSSISKYSPHVYESSVLLDDSESAKKMNGFIADLSSKASRKLSELSINDFNKGSSPLEGQDLAKKVSPEKTAEIISEKTEVSFEIPVKTEAKSNLNPYFGKGRKQANGLVKPRPWYEVEFEVPREITRNPDYPQRNAKFDVYTDDCWTFKCNTEGDFGKNFRSAGQLTILGRWIKGRLEASGALKIGEPVTADTLRKYGRDTVTFTQTKNKDVWYLDFGVEDKDTGK